METTIVNPLTYISQYLNNGGHPMKDFPWSEFISTLQTGRLHAGIPLFIQLRDALYPVHPVSQRIQFITCLKRTLYNSAQDASLLHEWEDAFTVLMRYYGRLRELTAGGKTVTRKWDRPLEAMDELSFLMEHIAPEEMVRMLQRASGIAARYRLNASPQEVIAGVSRIFGEEATTDIGLHSVFSFAVRLYAANVGRIVMTSNMQAIPRPDEVSFPTDLRNSCFDIYMHHRIHFVREELAAADDTRPFLPTDAECLETMIARDEAVMHRLDDDSVKRLLDKKQGVTAEHDILAWCLAPWDRLPQMIQLGRCYLNYEKAALGSLQQPSAGTRALPPARRKKIIVNKTPDLGMCPGVIYKYRDDAFNGTRRLTLLFQALCVKREPDKTWIAPDTDPEAFMSVFSNALTKHVIAWTAPKQCLYALFKLLKEQKIISTPHRYGLWQIVGSHFCDSGGDEFKDFNKEHLPRGKVRASIDYLVKILDAAQTTDDDLNLIAQNIGKGFGIRKKS